MLLTILAYAMIAIFMYVVMSKKMSPLSALVMVPLIFTIIAFFTGVTDITADPAFVKSLGDAKIANNLSAVGPMVLYGINQTAKTGIMLLFAILYFSIMLDTGLFDPITEKMIRFAKGDPMKVLMATAIVSAAVSMNGDGTTTTLIVVSAFLPIYQKLNMKVMNLGVLIILQNTIMNLLPWGGPTARAMSVLNVGSEILAFLAPGMIISLLYVIFIVAPSMGRKERKRLGITNLSDQEMKKLTEISDPEKEATRRPDLFLFNGIMTIVLITWLVAGSFIPAIQVPSLLLFAVGTIVALMVNYPNLKDQSKRIGDNAGDAVQVVILVFAAGIFMGLFQGSGMANALAQSFTTIIPKQLAGFWGLIIALLSAPGTFFLSNDGFYYGIMPVLAQAGARYGFDNMSMALASLMGQAFHLLSPLVAFIYLLLRLTGLDMGEWQRTAGKYALGIFIIFILTIILMGHMPIYIPQ
ncbi:CitMHS family transporter [Streptococcus porcinus]|uniref:Citrate transporter n=1 Tax=Streptococcus porcinus str. Jelinkova 176 TaxID=873448 RepID=A0ABN0CU92_STRPO|nr:citrate:proton symporter [Streptococcus porcinus]EGJ26880.1 citrate transporter [Streptococcus porcinus str. Jelinkova 176]SQG48413.1 Mg2+/citrate transporter [Streptococcus porcinus]